MRTILLSLVFIALANSSFAAGCNTAASKGSCGDGLSKQGWREVARCNDGHQWSYILEKDSNRKYCKGINARGGAEEYPCQPFNGDLEVFKSTAVNPSNCWDGFDQTTPQKSNP